MDPAGTPSNLTLIVVGSLSFSWWKLTVPVAWDDPFKTHTADTMEKLIRKEI